MSDQPLDDTPVAQAMNRAAERHADDITVLYQYFEYDHLPAGILRETSERFHELINELAYLPNTGETLACLRKLLEAKDCAVRSALHLT